MPDWLAKLLPTVASALVSPAVGLAIPVIAEALGLSEKTVEAVTAVVQDSVISPETLEKLKLAESQLKAQEMEYGFKYSELEFKDRDSARQREVQVRDNVNRNLAYGIIGAFIATIGFTLAGYTKIDTVTAGILIGYLSAKAEQVLAYYFGSTRSSQNKDSTISELTKLGASK